jgi:MFS family permease
MRLLRLIRVTRRGKTLLALASVILIYTFATSILQYNLALFTDSLAKNYTVFGIVMGLPWLFSLLTDIPAGAFAERFGKKRTIILGLLGLAMSGIFFYFVSGLIELFWVLVLFGTFEGFLTVAGLASVIAVSPHGKEHRFVGGYTSGSAIGYMIGPILGGFLVAWSGNRLPFLVFGAICLLAAVVAKIFIPAPEHQHDSFLRAITNVFIKDRIYVGGVREFFSVGRMSLFLGCSMILVGMWSEFIWALEPIFVNEIGLGASLGGIILTAFVVPFALFDYPIGRWIDRSGRRFTAMIAGLVMGGSGMILFSTASEPFMLVFLATVASFGYAFFYVAVNGVFDMMSDHHLRGHMTGIWQAAEDIGFVLGPVLGGIAADVFNLRGAFFAFGGFLFVAIFLALGTRKYFRRYEADPPR